VFLTEVLGCIAEVPMVFGTYNFSTEAIPASASELEASKYIQGAQSFFDHDLSLCGKTNFVA